jgi:hypothetical protein
MDEIDMNTGKREDTIKVCANGASGRMKPVYKFLRNEVGRSISILRSGRQVV